MDTYIHVFQANLILKQLILPHLIITSFSFANSAALVGLAALIFLPGRRRKIVDISYHFLQILK